MVPRTGEKRNSLSEVGYLRFRPFTDVGYLAASCNCAFQEKTKPPRSSTDLHKPSAVSHQASLALEACVASAEVQSDIEFALERYLVFPGTNYLDATYNEMAAARINVICSPSAARTTLVEVDKAYRGDFVTETSVR